MQARTLPARDRHRKRTEIHVGARVAAGQVLGGFEMAGETLWIGARVSLLGVEQRLIDSGIPTRMTTRHGPCPFLVNIGWRATLGAKRRKITARCQL
jgi:hypothetical protein